MAYCGHRTKTGGSCHYPRGKCPHHEGGQRLPPGTEPAPREASVAVPEAVTGRNLHGLGWWLVERVLSGEIEKERAATLVSVMRVIVSLGEEPPSDSEVEEEAILRAKLAFGMPPVTSDEWERAARLLDPETLREVRRQVEAADRRARELDSDVTHGLDGG